MRLEFGVGVRADFAVEVDLFMLRCGPFHGRRSFGLVMQDSESVSQLTKERNTEEPKRAKTSQNGEFLDYGRATTYRQDEERESQWVVVV
jgi:hypothetical protein